MTPEQKGRCVILGTVGIPAENINLQPRECRPNSGVYFQTKFEDGSLWLVTWGDDELSDMSVISVLEYPHWGMTHEYTNPGVAVVCTTWEEFLIIYKDKVDVAKNIK